MVVTAKYTTQVKTTVEVHIESSALFLMADASQKGAFLEIPLTIDTGYSWNLQTFHIPLGYFQNTTGKAQVRLLLTHSKVLNKVVLALLNDIGKISPEGVYAWPEGNTEGRHVILMPGDVESVYVDTRRTVFHLD